ncbi:RteC domain-containing protein [Flavobacteriaceae bacterium]|nr:RteC domain-containing protein [bacterium]MDB9913714.1 RteC domain-containing protein [Flavobacteriaceae bacterium]
MDELFKKTNEFLVEFYETLKKLEESTTPTGHLDDYDFEGELDSIFNELWEKENDYYLFGAGFEYQDIRNCELKELTEKGVYFRFCKFKVYEKTYKERLSKFLEIHEDAEEIDFIEDQLEAFLIPIGSDEPFKYLDLTQKKDLNYTKNKTVSFLVQKAKIADYNIIVSVDESDEALSYEKEKIKNMSESSLSESNIAINNIEPLKWKGTELELTELSKALIELGLISPDLTQKEIFKRLRAFLQVDDFNENDKLKDIRKRTNTKTPLLNKLETSLNNWIHKKD